MKKLDDFFSRYSFNFLLFLIISLIIFFKFFLMEGAVLGGDWALPITANEINSNLHNHFSSWTYAGNMLGDRLFAPTSLFFALILKLFSLVGMQGDMSAKIILVLLFALAGANFSFLLRYFKANTTISFIGGLFYILSPIFFNYSLMGWLYVILFLSFLPLIIYLFDLSIKNNDYFKTFLVAAIFSLTVVQSQVLVWVPMALLLMVLSQVSDKKIFWVSLKMFFIVMAMFLLLNFYWLPGMVLLQDSQLVDTSLVNTVVSLGTSARLSIPNILRLWGSLFNYQFETSMPSVLPMLSFLIPALAVCGLVVKRKKDYAIYLSILFISPILFYLLNRDYLASIPFSGLIRDTARFTVLSTFSGILLASLCLDRIYKKCKKKFMFLTVSLITLLAISFPFWSGSLFGGRINDYDFRFRTFSLSDEQIELEKKFNAEGDGKRALFLPIGGTISIRDSQLFSGAYQEMSDVYAGFSSVPGVSSISDRTTDAGGDMLKELNSIIISGKSEKLLEMAHYLDVDFVVFRRDLNYFDQDMNEISSEIESVIYETSKTENAHIYFDEGDLLVVNFVATGKKVTGSTDLISFSYPILNVIKEVSNETLANLFTKDDQRVLSKFFASDNMPSRQNNTYSIENQNILYGGGDIESANEKIFKFISIKEVKDILKSKELDAEKQITLTNDQTAIRQYRNIINIVEQNDIILSDKTFAVYLDDVIANATIYFDGQNSLSNSFLLNGEMYQCKNEGGVYKYHNIDLGQGLVTVESDYLIPDLIVVGENDRQQRISGNIGYEKINNSEYKITIEDDPNLDKYVLTFNDNFDPHWHLHYSRNMTSKTIASDPNHFIVNGYANGWTINKSDLDFDQGKTTIYLKYRSQQYFLFGIYISIVTLLLLAGYFLIKNFKRK